MKLHCDESLSNVAFNFNVRRYTEAAAAAAKEKLKKAIEKVR